LSLFNELKRRNVFRIAAAYVVLAWLLIQVTETIFPLFGFGDTPARLVVIVLAIGFIPSLILSWVFEFTPEGLKKDADVGSEKPMTLQDVRTRLLKAEKQRPPAPVTRAEIVERGWNAGLDVEAIWTLSEYEQEQQTIDARNLVIRIQAGLPFDLPVWMAQAIERLQVIECPSATQ